VSYLYSATSHRIEHGSAAMLDNLAEFTVCMWVYPTSFVDNRRLAVKGGFWGLLMDGAGGNIEFSVPLSAGTSNFITNDTPLSTANNWRFAAVTWKLSDPTKRVAIYKASLGGAVSECTYGTQTDPGLGSATMTDDAAGNLIVGCNAGSNQGFPGRVATFGLWNRRLTLAEIDEQCRFPHATDPAENLVFCQYGYAGNAAADMTGNGNTGTVTGPAVADHVPQRFARRMNTFGVG
jgi:hypothetical protein